MPLSLTSVLQNCACFPDFIHQVVEEEGQITLRCPHSVQGGVMWTRENNGNQVSKLTDDDGTLFISRVTVSDSERYFCNNLLATELTVIPSGNPSIHYLPLGPWSGRGI